MKRVLALLTAILAFAAFAPAQTATDLNEGSTFSYDPTTAIYSFSWWGRAGRTYFIQVSDDLIHWTYLREIQSGNDAVLGYEFTSTSSSVFYRLRYSDIPTTDPYNADFDGDGISNWQELLNGTDPLASSSNGSGIPDGWTAGSGLEPNADATLNNSSNHLIYSYDGVNRLSGLTAPATSPVDYTLDAEGNIQMVSQ